MTELVVRVSILRCEPSGFEQMRKMLVEAAPVLRPGIEAMPGLLAYFAGADEATHSLTNTSLWDTLEHAQEMDHYQPMLDAAKRFSAAGATFERPIMNYTTMWRFGGHAPP